MAGPSQRGRRQRPHLEGYVIERKTYSADFPIPTGGNITSEWYSSRDYGYHSALDIANDYYTNVYSSRRGTHYQYYSSSYGNYSVIDHDGGYETYYCHLNSWVAGHGASVGSMQHIAEMGSTGHSTGSHVHFEINYNGDEVYVAGEIGDETWEKTGVAKNYSGLSSFPNAP